MAVVTEAALAEIERRLRDRDDTLDLHKAVPDLIKAIRDRDARVLGLQAELNACQNEVADRDQRLERAQLAITRQDAMIKILRERMLADRATHALAEAALEAFDRGAVVIPDQET